MKNKVWNLVIFQPLQPYALPAFTAKTRVINLLCIYGTYFPPMVKNIVYMPFVIFVSVFY